ncbi:MAG TPA: M50 family metallopeptidase [Patescibacteria group bacterium]|nr:M50 family metallopeptidase [Patescibacteria group bacterium]
MLAILILTIKVIVAFSLLIMFHELGHFLVAKRSGVWVEEFGLGLPPRIFGKKIGDTIYSINWLPIGGFVRLHGETASDQVVYPAKAFTNKSKLTRILITVAGIVMNFILAIICFTVIFFVNGVPSNSTKLDFIILDVASNSPASISGIKSGDLVEKINNVNINSTDDLKNEINNNKGKEIDIEVNRNNKLIDIKATPRINYPADEGSLGISFDDFHENYFAPVWQRPFVSFWEAIKETATVTKAVVFGLGSAAKSVSQGQAPKDVTGPVGIIAVAKRLAEEDIWTLISFVAVVSINLGIVNLIPFPPLDGSRVALVIAEAITKKKLTAKMEERVYTFGFIVLIALSILITTHELPSVFKAGSLDNYANQVLNQK